MYFCPSIIQSPLFALFKCKLKEKLNIIRIIMKKIVLVAFALVVLFSTSCRKKTCPTYANISVQTNA
jgi:hypothetical protein